MTEEKTVEAKEVLIERYLGFVRRFAPKERLRVVTLGGAGLELKTLLRLGVAESEIWVVERDEEKSRKLAVEFSKVKAHFCCGAELHGLPKSLAAVYGASPEIDAFHADFCGTVETSFVEMLPMIPCLARSPHGGVFAVTVSDTRRNPALMNQKKADELGRRIATPEKYAEFLSQLTREQGLVPRAQVGPGLLGADPQKGARKEASVFGHIMSAMRGPYFERFPIVLTHGEVERYVVISTTSGRRCRMRTYVVHFRPASPGMDVRGILETNMNAWMSSPLYHIDSGGHVSEVVAQSAPIPLSKPKPVVVEVTTMNKKEEEMEKKTSSLEALVRATGSPELLVELQKLQSDSVRLCAVLRALQTEAQADIAGRATTVVATPVIAPVAPATVVAAASQPATEPAAEAQKADVAAKPEETAGESKPSKSRSSSRKGTKTRDEARRSMECRIDLFESNSKGPKKLQEAYKRTFRRLGIAKDSDRNHVVGGMLAHTSGKFRTKFLKSMLDQMGPEKTSEFIVRNAAFYQKIDGTTVTQKTLLDEAGIVQSMSNGVGSSKSELATSSAAPPVPPVN